jgi:Fe2+ or Zn2+ uptake regulation protein
MIGAMATDLDATVEERLRREGQRYTSGRRALVEALGRASTPVAATDLAPGMPLSSAYRNLAVLEQAGVVRRVITEDDFARYELAEDLTSHHHHLICSSCGRVEDVQVPPALERDIDRSLDRLARKAGFASVSHRLDLIGTCADCAAAGR